MKITGYEAHVLLFAFDMYFGTDSNGKVPRDRRREYSRKELQDLRNRLMAVHNHEKGK